MVIDRMNSDLYVSPLKWKEAVSEKPSTGTKIENGTLAADLDLYVSPLSGLRQVTKNRLRGLKSRMGPLLRLFRIIQKRGMGIQKRGMGRSNSKERNGKIFE